MMYNLPETVTSSLRVIFGRHDFNEFSYFVFITRPSIIIPLCDCLCSLVYLLVEPTCFSCFARGFSILHLDT